jgi:hypothetical protein
MLVRATLPMARESQDTAVVAVPFQTKPPVDQALIACSVVSHHNPMATQFGRRTLYPRLGERPEFGECLAKPRQSDLPRSDAYEFSCNFLLS